MSMKKQLKILNLIDIPWYSGISDYAFSQSSTLRENGHIIYFGCDRESESYKKAAKEGYKTVEITDRKKIITPALIFKLAKFIKDERIDIINAHTGRTQTLSYIVSRFKKVRIIRTKADAKDIKTSFIYKKLDLIICGSRYIANFYLRKGIDKTKVIYKSIIPPAYCEISSKEPFIIGITARLDSVKGHIYFIKSAIEILNRNFNCAFYIAGKEANLKWKELSNEIPEVYRNKFIYFGHLENIFEFMKKCHIGVITSIDSEAVSRVALEWMASARLVISTETGSLGEFIDNRFLVKPKDIHALSQKIIENLDFEKIHSEGIRNLEKIKREISYEKFKEETLNSFERVR